MSEIWKDIPGYEGKYQVSNMGRVKSLSRKVRCTHGAYRTLAERILRPGKRADGHTSVVLGHGAHGSQVHQLVMLAFVGPPPDKHEVCHINGNPQDNRLENLRYDTRTQNILDVYRTGRAWRKLTLAEVYEIRADLNAGMKGSNVARKYGISQTTVSAIKTGRTYSWAK